MHPAPELQRSQTFRPAPAFSDLARTLIAAELTALYVEQKLSLRQIAARYGVDRKLVARLARQYGITLRPPQTPFRHGEIGRAAAVSEYPSVTAAASALKLQQSVLHGQITRLETELGGPLLTRAERGHPMTLTDLGARVLQAWHLWAVHAANEPARERTPEAAARPC
jgi:transposase-like protein